MEISRAEANRLANIKPMRIAHPGSHQAVIQVFVNTPSYFTAVYGRKPRTADAQVMEIAVASPATRLNCDLRIVKPARNVR